MKKHIQSLLSLLFLTAILVLPFFVFAEDNSTSTSGSPALETLKTVATGGGYSAEAKLEVVVGTVISGALSLLGAIFIILIIIGGYRWMTAGGNEKGVEDAQNYIKRAIIGLIVTLSAWAIWSFLLQKLVLS